ncbi:MAG: 50S ribosomal protein L9 [Micromonosporaceae bacterium]
MKIILTQEISGLGEPGDVVDVKDGYARNYLLPQAYAIRWTRGGEKQVATIRRAREVRGIKDLDQAQEIKTQLEGLRVKMSARAGAQGRLFGSITSAEVVTAVNKAGGPQLDRRRLELPGAIKAVGSYQVKVRLHPEVSATIPVEVTAAK